MAEHNTNKRKYFQNAAVLGASGTIGSLVGGIIAQSGIHVDFLSRDIKGSRRGLQRAIKQARSEVISRHIECWDYKHDLAHTIGKAELIIESVSEDIEIKRQVYALIERYRRPGTIVGTTTSSLPLSKLIENRSEDFKSHFISTHFYNPPVRMTACEVACTESTKTSVYDLVCSFLRTSLRREVIPVRNIPAFAGNRIAFLLLNRIAHLAREYGVEMMEYLIGPYTGRLMAPLATLDLVGLDVYKAIITNLALYTSEGENGLESPSYVQSMLENGLLGTKVGQGFYKILESSERTFIDPHSLDYVPAFEPHIQFVEKAKRFIHLGMYQEAFDVIVSSTGTEANIVKEIIAGYIYYAFSLIGEVTDRKEGIADIDRVMSSGFNWAPPSTLVHLLGGNEAATNFLSELNFEVPESLSDEHLGVVKTKRMDYGRYFVAM